MTREEANITIDYLEEMQEGYIEGEGYERYPLPEWYALDKAIQTIEQTTWIPVSEKLPEETESVLVYAERNAYGDNGVFRKKVVDIGWQVDGRWHIDGCNGVEGIAWMPLPEPYKRESEAKNADSD